MKKEKKQNFVLSSSRRVSVRDISRFFIPCTTILRGDSKGVRGFTLIELLVVVLIIGILSAVALPQYRKAVARARGAEAIAMIRSVIPAIEEYMMANNAFPPSWDVLSISGTEFSKYSVNNDTLIAGNYRYILVQGRLDVDPIANGKPGPKFIWQSPYTTFAKDELPQRSILCYYFSSDDEFGESICKTYGSTVLRDRFIEVQ